jgi:hypothetical protein
LWSGILKEEVVIEVHNHRVEAYPISDKMNKLLGERRVGIELDSALRELSAFYGKTLGDMRAAFKQQKVQNYQANSVDTTLVQKEKEFVKRYAKCLVESKLYILDMEATRMCGQQRLIGVEAMGNKNKSNTVLAKMVDPQSGKETTKKMSLFDYCMSETADMKEFDGFTFDPHPRAGRRTKDNKFNTWFGFPVKGKIGDASLINDHIKNVWCGNSDDHAYHWVMSYLAHIFQRPWEKPGSAIVLGGPPGTGKSMPLEHGIGKMVAPYYGKSSRPDDICGRFTAFSCNKIVFLSEEAVWSGDKKMLRQLKERVTGGTTNWEQKMLPAVEVPDFVRLFFTSNDAHIFDLDGDDRRYCILDTATTHQNDLKYFGRMKDWFDDGGREIWFNYLSNYKPEVPFVELRSPPLTAARLRQVSMSRPPSAEFFVDLIKHGKLTTLPRDVDVDVQLAWPLDSEWAIRGEKFKIVFDQYVRYFTGSNFRYERNHFPTQFIKYIGSEYASLIKQRVDPDRPADKRARCLVLPPRRAILAAQMDKAKPEFTQQDLSWAEDNPGSHAEA